MDQTKAFKTIEVTDSRTRQVCKVACMSCIRGHRTTSCGIPVCRTKVFWTVKRPGRPSNSCTCRFGPTGRCQCVVAKGQCPHKPKKGEKRTMDCRCDEQGRFCCLLEPEHWDALCALQKPSVEFFTSREALDARHASPPAAAFPPTPSYSAGTPQTVMSVPSTPTPTNGIHFVHTTGEHFADTPSPARGVPVFGMMGLGAPMGDHHRGQDVLTWDGQSPPAPLEFQPYSGFKQSEMALPASPIPFSAPLSTPYPYIPPSDPNFAPQDFVPVTQSLHDLTLPSQDPIPSTLDFDKMMADYFSYQFPSAICQNCGMNGCTCRNCPAVMQNFESGSWAQCCSRKHVRYAAQVPMPGTQAAHPEGHVDGQGASQVAGLQGALDPTFTQDMQVDDLKMLDDGTQPMDLSEFLLNDLEEQRPSGGCCCGD